MEVANSEAASKGPTARVKEATVCPSPVVVPRDDFEGAAEVRKICEQPKNKVN